MAFSNGVSSAPGIFQCIIDNLLRDNPHVCAYQDEILITDKSKEEHIETLHKVLERLANCVQIQERGRLIFRGSVEYLRFRVDHQGLHLIDTKTKAIQNAPPPKNVSELKSFLGMVSHLNRFFYNCATLLSPLHGLLNKHQRWTWNLKEQQSFNGIKTALSSIEVIIHYDPKNH